MLSLIPQYEGRNYTQLL